MTNSLKHAEITKIAKKTIKKFKICDHCLGRIFAKIESGISNKKRGEILRCKMKNAEKIEVKNCWLCKGLIDEINHFADLISNSLKYYEYETFLVGSKVDEDIIDRENKLFEYSGSEFTESIKSEINREVGKILEKKIEHEVNFKNPTIMVVIDTAFDVVKFQINSLFIYGRYKKFSRSIPQTKWFCKTCRGKGCKKCNYSGKMYETSVEELVSKKFLEITEGDDEAFHGCGREDIDVLMLGNGRPFVLEIKNPKKRTFDLSKIEAEINTLYKDEIEVNGLRLSDRDEIKRIKAAGFKKTYKIVFKCKKPINNEKLKKAILSLRGTTIGQFTPSRVAHRRANMIREKQIYNCSLESIDGTIATLTLEAESGTYIKELVSGDDGRTKPSISEIIGAPCEVIELDVIEIKGE